MNAILLVVVAASSAAASKLSPAASFADAPIPPSEREFLINGWRWHHRSVLRELRRFIRCLERVDACEPESLRRALDAREFVWGFSWSALHGIEVDLYLPWLRQRCGGAVPAELDELQRELAEVWASASGSAASCRRRPRRRAAAAAPPAARHRRRRCAGAARPPPPGGGGAPPAEVVQALELRGGSSNWRAMYARTERTLVPGVAAYVPRPSRASTSRCWVSRRVAVARPPLRDGGGDQRRRRRLLQFKRQIPKVARMMLPRWRQTHLPRTECPR